MMSQRKASNQRPSKQSLKRRLDSPNNALPFMGSRTLRYQGGAMRTTIMQEAWKDADIDTEDSKDAAQIYFPDEEILLIDLS